MSEPARRGERKYAVVILSEATESASADEGGESKGRAVLMEPGSQVRPNVTTYRPPTGWLVYDGECALCTRLVRWFRQPLERCGYAFVPLQAPWSAARLHISYGVAPEDLLKEMRVLTGDGRCLGGSGAILHLAREIWWTWPLWLLAKLPGMRALLDFGYCTVAKHRHCVGAVGQRITACAVGKRVHARSRSA